MLEPLKRLAYTSVMLKWYARLVGASLFLLGLWGFFYGHIPTVVRFDPFQSFVYLVFGAVGLKLGFSLTNPKHLAVYATATGLMGLILLLFGLTFPNFYDIFHLEVSEHVFHAALGVAGCLIGDFGKRKLLQRRT